MGNQDETKVKRKYTKRAAVKPVRPTEGRFLIVENTTCESISFRNPDSRQNGQADLTVPGYTAQVVNEMWMDVAWFIRAINDGLIVTYRGDELPKNRDLTVTGSYDLSGNKQLDAQALGIVNNAEYGQKQKDLIRVNPKGQGDMVDKDWLKESGSKFLHNIIEREKRFRCRKDLIEDCQKRLLEIQSL